MASKGLPNQRKVSASASELPTLSDSELSKMLKTINLQIEVTGLLASLNASLVGKSAKEREKEKDAVFALQQTCALSLFDKRDAIKSELAEYVSLRLSHCSDAFCFSSFIGM
jgi:hypothetical protein